MVRVRFAPSATGSLHVGDVQTALAIRTFANDVGAALPEPAPLPPNRLDAKALVGQLKAVDGDFQAVRFAVANREGGAELWVLDAAVPREGAPRRIDAAL